MKDDATRSKDDSVRFSLAHLSGADRRAHVQKWLSRNLDRISVTAGGAVLLALPAMQASAAEQGYVALDQIGGVKSATRMADGSLQLTLDNGTTVTVAAGDVAVVDGALSISSEAAEVVAEVAAGAGAGGFGGGGVAMAAGAAGLAAAAAAGGGNSSDGPPTLNLETILGTGFTSGNTGFTAPEGTQSLTLRIGGTEYTVTPNPDGSWSLPIPQADIDDLPQGNQTIEIIANGPDGPLESTEVRFNIDTEAPEAPNVALTNDTGTDGADLLTNDAALTVSALESGGTREFIVNGTSQGGTYAPPTESGTYTVEVIDTDRAGNSTSTTLTFTLDVTAPAAPAVALVADTGPTDGITTNAALTIADPEAGTTRVVTLNGVAQGDSYAAPTEDGTYTVVVTDTDAAGNSGSTTLTFTLDTTSPADPLVALTNDTGTTQGLTNDAALTISAPEAGASRDITVNGTSQGATYTPPTTDGDYEVVVTDTDGAGNTASTTVIFTLDTTAPATPSAALTNDTGTTQGLTSDAALTLSDPEAGATRVVTVNGAPQGATYTPPTTDGDYEVVVTDTDGAGNSASTTVVFTLDTASPAVPSVELTNDTGAEDGITSDAALTLSTPEAGATRDITVNGTSQGATYTPPTTDGDYEVVVTDTDGAGNGDSTTVIFTLDTTAPVLTLDELPKVDLAAARDGVTVTGSTQASEAGQTVVVTFEGVDYNAVVQGDGSFSADIPAQDIAAINTAQGDTPEINVAVNLTDVAGNAAGEVTASVTANFQGPSIQISAVATDDVINAIEAGGQITISGSTANVEDGQAVTLQIGASSVPGVTVGANGNWSVTIDPATYGLNSDGDVTVTADVQNAGGIDAVQASRDVTVDVTPPTVTITAPVAGDGVINATENAGLTVSGTTTGVEDGQMVTLTLGTATVQAEVTGNAWSATLAPGLTDGANATLTATVADAAGNPAAPDTAALTADLSATLTIGAVSAGATLDAVEQDAALTVTGSTEGVEAGQTVTVTVDGQQATAQVQANGTWSATFTPAQLHQLTDGANLTIAASVEDAAGNAASGSVALATDFTPILSMDPIATGANGVFDADDDLAVTGSSHGLAEGATVDVTVNGTVVGQATVGATGDWALTIPESSFDQISGGDSVSFAAQDSGGAASAVTDSAVAFQMPGLFPVQVTNTGTALQIGVVADPDSIDRDFDVGGLRLIFDQSGDVTYTGKSDGNGVSSFVEYKPAEGEVSVAYTPEAQGQTIDDASQPLTILNLSIQDQVNSFTGIGTYTTSNEDGTLTSSAGPWQMVLGSSGDDTIAGLDPVLGYVRGGGGDDAIDLSAAAPKVLVFEGLAAANGHDTITNFTPGGADDFGDVILIELPDPSVLRGDGTGIQEAASGDALGTNTGLLAYSTELSSLSEAALAEAAETLTGANAGDIILMGATDGTDTVFAQITYDGAGNATAELMATFEGLAHPDFGDGGFFFPSIDSVYAP